MKYLMILALLLLVACVEKSREDQVEENKRVSILAQSYIGMCFKDRNERGLLAKIENEEMAGVKGRDPRSGLAICHLVDQCDIKNKLMCVTAEICSKWVSNKYFLDTILQQVKPSTCP
jgi:hypothetical protein